MGYAGRLLQRIREAEEEAQNNAKKEKEALTPQEQADYNELLKQFKSKNYTDFINYLNTNGADDKVKRFLTLGFGGTDNSKNEIFKVNTTNISVNGLKPTQSEIDIDNSLAVVLTGQTKEGDSVKVNPASYFSGEPLSIGKNPVFIYNGEYIIDGHHRWSQVFCVNPNKQIKVDNLHGSLQDPINVLKTTQAVIKQKLPNQKLPSLVVSGQNIYQMSEEDIKKYISSKLTTDDQGNPTGNLKLFIDYFKTASDDKLKAITNKDQFVAYLTQNCLLLQKKNKPAEGAPNRGEMPQTTEKPLPAAADADSVVNDMTKCTVKLENYFRKHKFNK